MENAGGKNSLMAFPKQTFADVAVNKYYRNEYTSIMCASEHIYVQNWFKQYVMRTIPNMLIKKTIHYLQEKHKSIIGVLYYRPSGTSLKTITQKKNHIAEVLFSKGSYNYH